MLSQPVAIGSVTGPPSGSADAPASPSDPAAADGFRSSAAPGPSSDAGEDSRQQRIVELEAQKQASELADGHALKAW